MHGEEAPRRARRLKPPAVLLFFSFVSAVLRGESFTMAADVYSFGLILWEMVTRRIPYESKYKTKRGTGRGRRRRDLLVPSLTLEFRSSSLLFNAAYRGSLERRKKEASVVLLLLEVSLQPGSVTGPPPVSVVSVRIFSVQIPRLL